MEFLGVNTWAFSKSFCSLHVNSGAWYSETMYIFHIAEMVKDACGSRMVQAWLRLYEGNVLELLKALDVENSAETPEVTLKTIFKKTPVPELIANFDILNEE